MSEYTHPRVDKELTDLQKHVIVELRKLGYHFLASDTQDCWRQGKSWQIDSRIDLPGWLKREFNKCNEIATS